MGGFVGVCRGYKGIVRGLGHGLIVCVFQEIFGGVLKGLGIFVALGDFLKVLLGIGGCVKEFKPG